METSMKKAEMIVITTIKEILERAAMEAIIVKAVIVIIVLAKIEAVVEAAVVVVAATTQKELTERGRVPWIQRTLNNK